MREHGEAEHEPDRYRGIEDADAEVAGTELAREERQRDIVGCREADEEEREREPARDPMAGEVPHAGPGVGDPTGHVFPDLRREHREPEDERHADDERGHVDDERGADVRHRDEQTAQQRADHVGGLTGAAEPRVRGNEVRVGHERRDRGTSGRVGNGGRDRLDEHQPEQRREAG